jgi:hydroxyacylglutathione hydrolase
MTGTPSPSAAPGTFLRAGALEIAAVPILSDNYAWLLRDTRSGAVAAIDPAEAAPVEAALDAAGGRLDLVLLTHHHQDHIAEAAVVAHRHGARLVGADADRARLPPLDAGVSDGDTVMLGQASGTVIATPGHARHHISFFFADGPVLFPGDTLFSLGCGRLLEGTAAEMFGSLHRFDGLPDDTLVCPGHEYTESNLRFALSLGEPAEALRKRGEEVRAQRAAGTPTVPVRLGTERCTNPFIMAPDATALAGLRTRKDAFR